MSNDLPHIHTHICAESVLLLISRASLKRTPTSQAQGGAPQLERHPMDLRSPQPNPGWELKDGFQPQIEHLAGADWKTEGPFNVLCFIPRELIPSHK